MNEKRASLEVIAPSVEEAVAKGLEDLGLAEEAVDVEVLDPGSKGLFGLGSRQARVRLTIKSAGAQPEEAVRQPVASAKTPEAAPVTTFDTEPAAPPRRAIDTSEVLQEDDILRVAQEIVMDLLEKMKVRAQVTASYGEVDEAHSKAPLMVDIHGNDLSILIGPRAETLNALQYISGLIVAKELGHSVPLVVDVEGYRKRREQQIRQLARRMADQAIKTGRRQVLEPMPANERRIVHIELRGNPDVTTQSIGEEPRRKVTIVPAK